MTHNDGYATVYAILVLAALSILATAASGPLTQAGARLRVEENSLKEEAELEGAVAELIRYLASDPTPKADSPWDPVWQYVSAPRTDGIRLSLEDLSTGLNLNAIDPIWLKEQKLTGALAGLGNIELLYDKRLESFFRTKEEVHVFVPENTIGTLFSLYGYINPNTTDSKTLARYLEDRLEDSEIAISLANDLVLHAQSKRLFESDIQRILGARMHQVSPVIAAVPMINVNMADRTLLDVVLSLPFSDEELEDPSKTLNSLMLDKLAGEVYPFDIHSGVDADEEHHMVFSFLGATTWFWLIRAENEDGKSLTVIIARLPYTEERETPVFQVIEKTWGEGI